jgi:hypothetical protein
MTRSLVRPLFDGPLDIVGDVHGEIDALRGLLSQLGYAEDGAHHEGRRLVFVGDLTDRGPDSPAVVELVERFVNGGRAQCVLGNHELNLLLGRQKHDNHWFFGRPFALDRSEKPTPAKLADDAIRSRVLRFFGSLPLVLERPGLRIVHACWNDDMVRLASSASDTCALYDQHKDEIDARHRNQTLEASDRDLDHQNLNPVKMLTSGPERLAANPAEIGGEVRHLERVVWWQDYSDQPTCVFGHYSIYRDEREGTSRAICVDFAVAKRWQERTRPDFSGSFRGLLGALRVPEGQLVFDNGECEHTYIADDAE